MKKMLALLGIIAAIPACSLTGYQESEVIFDPDYNHLAANARVISQSPLYVTYEYRNIRVDELAPVAAQYCQNRGNKQAALYKITLQRDNARRATFVCRDIDAK